MEFWDHHTLWKTWLKRWTVNIRLYHRLSFSDLAQEITHKASTTPGESYKQMITMSFFSIWHKR